MPVDNSKLSITNLSYDRYLKSQCNDGKIIAYFNYMEMSNSTITNFSSDILNTNNEYCAKFPELHKVDTSTLTLVKNVISVLLNDIYDFEDFWEIDGYLFRELSSFDEPYKDFNVWVIVKDNNTILVEVHRDRSGFLNYDDEQSKLALSPTIFNTQSISYGNHVYDSIHSLIITPTLAEKYNLFNTNANGKIKLSESGFAKFLENSTLIFKLYNTSYSIVLHRDNMNTNAIYSLKSQIAKLYLRAQRLISESALKIPLMLTEKELENLIIALDKKYSIDEKTSEEGCELFDKVLSESGLSDFRFLVDVASN